MPSSAQFSALIADLTMVLGLESSPGEEGDSFSVDLEDGIRVHILDGGDEWVALVADTGIGLSDACAQVRSEALDLLMQINFATVMSTRLATAQGPGKTIVLTSSERIANVNGQQLLEMIDFAVEKARDLRQLLQDIQRDAPSAPTSSDADLALGLHRRA